MTTCSHYFAQSYFSCSHCVTPSLSHIVINPNCHLVAKPLSVHSKSRKIKINLYFFVDHERKSVAADQLSVSVYGGTVGILGQRHDCFADDSGDNSSLRGDGVESRANSYVNGHLLEHRRCFDSRWRSSKCHNCFEQPHC